MRHQNYNIFQIKKELLNFKLKNKILVISKRELTKFNSTVSDMMYLY